MIKVDRGRYHSEPPEFVFDDVFVWAQQELKVFYLEGGGQFQKQKKLDTKYLLASVFKPISKFIADIFYEKCAYSERKIVDVHESNLHFHRPIRDALDETGNVSPDHYWWLMFDWKNWYLAADQINRSAANFFPVFGDRSQVDEERMDRGVLLDPCDDEPASYLSFDEVGRVSARSVRGFEGIFRADNTIRFYALNDKKLVNDRHSVINDQFKVLHQYAGAESSSLSADKIRQVNSLLMISRQQEFAGCLRQNAVRIAKEGFEGIFTSEAFQKEYQVEIEAEFASSNTADTARQVEVIGSSRSGDQQRILRHESIQHIEIRNFKGIDHLDLSLLADTDDIEPDSEENHSNKPWTVFLGENGCGKSSILQAIAWALAYTGSESTRAILGNDADLFERRYLRRGETQAEISLWFGESASVTLTYDKQRAVKLQRSLTTDSQLQVFVRAYGATRLSGSDVDEQTSFEQIRIMNLLDPDARLIKPEDWLLTLHRQDPLAFNRAAATLLELMPHQVGVSHVENTADNHTDDQPIRIEDDEVMVYDQPLNFVSDGYRSVITLACDMMAGLAEGFGDYASAPGIIIIDEMGAHLHPRWRMKIVNALKRSFPNLQFIVSTHEPLCLRGLRSGEVIKVQKQLDENDQFELLVERINRNPSQLRVDQLLTSEFFGLDSTIDPAIDELFGRYYRLLAKQNLTEQEQAERQQLKQQLYRHNTLGFSRRDRMVYELIDQFIADNPLRSSINQLSVTTRQEIVDLLKGQHYFTGESGND